jgi:hypothetical protein
MTQHEGEATGIERAMEVLSEHGLEGMAKAVELLMNEAMKLERAMTAVLQKLDRATRSHDEAPPGGSSFHYSCSIQQQVFSCRESPFSPCGLGPASAVVLTRARSWPERRAAPARSGPHRASAASP